MTKEEILEKIETILPKLNQWIKYKEVSFEPEELTIVKDLSKVIQPGKIVSWGCPPCAGEVLNTIIGYYQKEKKD